MAKNQTKEELLEIKKRAFQIYTADPSINNTALGKEVGVNRNTIRQWIESEEWIDWSNRAFSFINYNLRDKVSKLDEKILTYVDDLITGSLDADQLRGASAVVNIFKCRLEMAGFLNKRAGTEINNNFISNKQVNNVAIDNMNEEQLLKFITTNEVPKTINDITPIQEKETVLIESPIRSKKAKKKKVEPTIDFSSLGIEGL